jgi:hypothetical protein
MAKPKQARAAAGGRAGAPVRPADLGEAGGGIADPDAACDNAIGLIVADISRIKAIVGVTSRVLTPDEGSLVATYARTLSAISRDRRRSDKPDNLSGKSMEELAEMARQHPELLELLGGAQ